MVRNTRKNRSDRGSSGAGTFTVTAIGRIDRPKRQRHNTTTVVFDTLTALRLYAPPGPAFVYDPGPILDSAPRPAFNFDPVGSHNSDLDEAGGKQFLHLLYFDLNQAPDPDANPINFGPSLSISFSIPVLALDSAPRPVFDSDTALPV
ncbi:hypothetical protein EVAR_87657_1 [Eumeta japonica]|uniref:Uncharacterized protein n=1 Tax=Eumeta variegata TaxID=151549 RepID=A0A4C1WJQ7_EUMVA|nr:hypothetical protein EVAR_87657_1 [Eumeta japonica]